MKAIHPACAAILFATACAGVGVKTPELKSCTNLVSRAYWIDGSLNKHIEESIRTIPRDAPRMEPGLADAIRSDRGVGIIRYECSPGAPDFIQVLLAFPNKNHPWYEVHVPIRLGKIVWPRAEIARRME